MAALFLMGEQFARHRVLYPAGVPAYSLSIANDGAQLEHTP
jgi:hypothetical protein